MEAEKIELNSVKQAAAIIEKVGAGSYEFMAQRAIHINILVRGVPGDKARVLKKVYNDIGAEAAISHDAYFGEEGAVTDMIVMGNVYHHREARRILTDNPKVKSLMEKIQAVVESAPEILG